MAENSKIEWTTHTFNPWVGCTKVSPACDHCYAESWAKRAGSPELWKGERRHTTDANWRKPLVWDRAAKAAGERHRVFCASLADVFDNQVPEAWRDQLWLLIKATPNLDWLLLTKRPQNIRKMLPKAVFTGRSWGADEWPNVWLGTTAENQGEYDRRFLGHLYDIPVAVRFISYEPALGPLDPSSVAGYRPDRLICGGESGGNARMMDPAWAREVRDICKRQGTAFFMKQMTGKKPIPSDLLVREFPQMNIPVRRIA